MNSCERKAEELILYAHKKGGTIELEEVLKEFDKNYISDDVMLVLDIYGKTGSAVLDSAYGWTWFQLSEKGMLFARRGCFTGEARRDQLVKIGAIAAIIAAIAGIIQLFL